MAAPSNVTPPPIPITSLSVGLMVRHLLSSDTRIASLATKIYPVVAEADAKLPYVCYRRANFERQTAKGPGQGADAVAVELLCYGRTYAESVELAEAVRDCLDHKQATYTDTKNRTLVARSIDLLGSEEGWADDAFAQSIVFTIRVNNE